MIFRKGLLLVISGPSGTGKGTICRYLTENNENIRLSVSATTRKPRIGEVDGVNYFFKSKEDFEEMIENGGFMEYASIYGNYYGTPKKAIFDEMEKGNDIILEIEMQGAIQIKEAYPEAVLIFILPPSLKELKERIMGRGTETEEQIEKRFSCAYDEIKMLGNYDYYIFNEVVENSARDILNIVDSEKQRVTRYKDEIFDLFEKEIKKC